MMSEPQHNHVTRNMTEPDCPACEEYVAKFKERREAHQDELREKMSEKYSSSPLETRGAAVGKFGHTSGRIIR